MYSDVIAHRGASGLAGYENTLEAFMLAIKLGADYVEFDVRKTNDEKLIVFHDAEIEGVSIASVTYKYLNTIASKKGYKVPLLSEVLDLCSGKIKLDIELKETGYEKAVIDLVREKYAYSDFVMKSFSDASVLHIKKYDSRITAGLLLGKKHASLKRRLHEYFPKQRLLLCHADFVSPNYRLCTGAYIKRMHKIGMKVFIWTINSPKAIKRCFTLKADGIITDRPDLAISLRRHLKSYV